MASSTTSTTTSAFTSTTTTATATAPPPPPPFHPTSPLPPSPPPPSSISPIPTFSSPPLTILPLQFSIGPATIAPTTIASPTTQVSWIYSSFSSCTSICPSAITSFPIPPSTLSSSACSISSAAFTN
ncbi:hypothetical protein CYMTET_21284 [Cymbomonas tetramitiformis]|uniref:Uncharacterized protein n=1 Tax=Cymbomonas tetramitiformis TaxID=36881 RepID=A0AAE0G2C5_9CHLO|nr:hypothetical protein CYMTET_21284 [Cymbomonas tetramitiformis]